MMILSLARSKALVAARREQRRLVHEVRQVRARETGRAARQHVGAHVGRQRHLAHVHLQDFLPAADVGQRHHDLPVEAAGTQQRGIEDIGPVGRRDDDHAHRGLEAVHLDEQLVERLLALVVAAAQARAALAADRVDLVDEHDAGRVLLRLFEHVAHARRAHADEHLHEVGSRDREERYLRLARDGAREQRLAGARVADHQHAAGNPAAKLLELGRVTQEVDQLRDFLLRLLAARDVGEGHRVGGLVQHARARLAETEGASAPAALHLAHEEDPHADQQQHREPGDEDLGEHRLLFLGLGRHLDPVLHEVAHHPDVVQPRRIDEDLLVVLGGGADRATLDLDLADLPLAGCIHELRVLHGRRARVVTSAELVEHRHQDQADDQPDDEVF